MKCCFCSKKCCEHGGLKIYVHKEFECTALSEVKVPYVCGDYNIDLMKVKINKHAIVIIWMKLYHMAFFPKISLPTRIGDNSSTLIDNIFTNNIEEADISDILLNHISDHQMMYRCNQLLKIALMLQIFLNLLI